MSFFRAVIYLLMQRRFDLYIAYRGLAGSQLKKSLPLQRYFSPWIGYNKLDKFFKVI